MLLPIFAKADGGIMPRPDFYVNETGQKAFIYFQNQTENLVISTSYLGNSSDFAWIIPVPNKAEISKSSAELFTNLQKITSIYDSDTVTFDSAFSLGSVSKSQPVEVVEEKTIDIYDTAILKAIDDKALSNWLNDHGYTFPKNKSAALQSYIDDGWYFVVAKIQTEVAKDAVIKNQLATGTITPLRLTFETNKIIYPMKLTGIALEYATENSRKQKVAAPSSHLPVVLYVLSNSKTSQSFLATSWANWIDANKIKDLNNGENWIKSGSNLFLTRMTNSINIEDMSDDFVVEEASNNDIYPIPIYKTIDFWLVNVIALIATILISILSLFGLIFITFILLQHFVAKNKAIYIIGNVYQILYCTALIFIWLMFYLIIGSQSFLLESGTAGVTLGLLLVLTTAIFFTIKMLKRYKKVFST